MKIEIHNGLREPQTLTVTRVLILDKNDTPVAVAVEVEDGIILSENADNPHKLNALLRGLGIDRTVLVHDARQLELPQINVTG